MVKEQVSMLPFHHLVCDRLSQCPSGFDAMDRKSLAGVLAALGERRKILERQFLQAQRDSTQLVGEFRPLPVLIDNFSLTKPHSET